MVIATALLAFFWQTVAAPPTKKELARKERALKKELAGEWDHWLTQDVPYIITDEERVAYKRLHTDDERQRFVESFWLRRDPTPDTEENEYKEEHYRRIMYANDHFSSGIPGWRTDRGRIYITFGPPDEIESHPSGGSYQRPYDEGGGQTSTFPFEQWRYRNIENIGPNIIVEFVDPTMSGEYHTTIDPGEKDGLAKVPGAGLTTCEAMGTCSKADRFSRTDLLTTGTGNQPLSASMNPFTRLDQYKNLFTAPRIKDKALEEAVNSSIRYNTLPMQVRADYIRISGATTYANLMLEFKNSDLNYLTRDQIAKANISIYGKLTTQTRRTVNWFEDTLKAEIPVEMLPTAMNGSQVYSKRIPLAPGTYRLDIVAKDLAGNTANHSQTAVIVPDYGDEQLATSSLILADQMERVPNNSMGADGFVIRSTKVRPRMSGVFRQNEIMGVYTEFYNLGIDAATKRMVGMAHYEVINNTTQQTVLQYSEALTDQKAYPNASPFLVVVEKRLPLKDLAPGRYTLRIRVEDQTKSRAVETTAQFTVNGV